MARTLKNCFIFGEIGVKPARLVFGETDTPKPPETTGTPEAREAKEATTGQVESARNELNAKIAALEKTLDKQCKSTNPNIKKAAERAKEELAKIKTSPGNALNETQIRDNLALIGKIPEYMKECQACEKPLDDNKKLMKANVTPLMTKIEERFSRYVNNPAYAKLSEAAKEEIAKMRDDTMTGVNKTVESMLPLTVSGRLSLDEYIKDKDYFKNQLKKENDLLKNTESDLFTKIEEETQRVANMDAEQLAVCYTDIAQNEANAVEVVNKIKTGMTNDLEETNKINPLPNLDTLKQELAKICDDTNTRLLSPEMKGPENSARRALIMARMRDQLLEFTAKVNKSEVEQGQKDSCVIALVRRKGLPAGMDAAAVAKELGVDQKIVEEAAKKATTPASTPPPVSGEGPVKPATTAETAPSTPQLASVISPEKQASIDKLKPDELRTLVASAPGEVRDAMLKIAQYGENPGQMIKFKILLSKSLVDCYFVKEGGSYRFKRPDPVTGEMLNLFTYGSRMDALKALHNGTFMQEMILGSLKNRAYYDAYEKKGLIDMKDGPTQDADRNSVIFRLDWKGLSNVSGNPVIRATALPYGAIAYTVNRDGVGLDGGKIRHGLASNMADLFRQLNHLQGWAEGSEARKEKPAQMRQAEIAYETAYSQLNDPANFYAHQDRIGRPVYFGINTISKDTDMSLDWGGGLNTDTDVNPTVRMRLGGDGRFTYRIEYKGETTDSPVPVATVGQVIDAVAAYRAQKMKMTIPPVAGSWSPERWAAHIRNPLALLPQDAGHPEGAPTQVAGTPGTAPAEQVAGTMQTPGTTPGGAPPVVGTPVAGAETTAATPPAVPAGGPAGGPAEGAKTPAGEAAKKAEAAKNSAEAAQKRVAEIVSGAQGKNTEEVNKAITEARAEAEKANNAAKDARKAAEEAEKERKTQLEKAEAAKTAADKAEKDKAENMAELRKQSKAETEKLTAADNASKEAEKSAAAAEKAATEASAKAASLKAPEATPPAATATPPGSPPVK